MIIGVADPVVFRPAVGRKGVDEIQCRKMHAIAHRANLVVDPLELVVRPEGVQFRMSRMCAGILFSSQNAANSEKERRHFGQPGWSSR